MMHLSSEYRTRLLYTLLRVDRVVVMFPPLRCQWFYYSYQVSLHGGCVHTQALDLRITSTTCMYSKLLYSSMYMPWNGLPLKYRFKATTYWKQCSVSRRNILYNFSSADCGSPPSIGSVITWAESKWLLASFLLVIIHYCYTTWHDTSIFVICV